MRRASDDEGSTSSSKVPSSSWQGAYPAEEVLRRGRVVRASRDPPLPADQNLLLSWRESDEAEEKEWEIPPDNLLKVLIILHVGFSVTMFVPEFICARMLL